MAEFYEINEYFQRRDNKDGTCDIADKKGNVFAEGVKGFKLPFSVLKRDDYIITRNANEAQTLWNKKGQAMPGAKDVDLVRLYSGGDYEAKDVVGNWTYYDNGAKAKKICRITLTALCVMAVLGVPGTVIKGCSENALEEAQAKKEGDNKLDATYMGSVPQNGYEYAYFNTDKNPKTAEFKKRIGTDEEAVIYLNMQKGETKKSG